MVKFLQETVFILEHDSITAAVLHRSLLKAGYSTKLFTSTEELNGDHVLLILSDYALPVQRIVDIISRTACQVILTTARNIETPFDRDKISVVKKPYDITSLITMVRDRKETFSGL